MYYNKRLLDKAFHSLFSQYPKNTHEYEEAFYENF